MGLIAAIAVLLVLFALMSRKKARPPVSGARRVLVVLGSGGHTTEMLTLLKAFDSNLWHFVFVLASTDSTSETRVLKLFGPAVFERIPRSREVGQSYVSSILSTFISLLYCITVIVRNDRFDAILCNGPGTCIPLCILFWILNLLRFILGFPDRTRIVFVESFCRVKTLSLSGKILYRIADRFVVQWPQLKKMYPRAEYLGILS
jgi:beta-1,4-N-acetylglucosaminyltransferase